MAIDLIPSAWRQARRTRRLARTLAIGMAVAIGAVATAKGGVMWTLRQIRPEVTLLRQTESRTAAHRTAVDGLRIERTALRHRLAAMAALRSEGAPSTISAALQNAVDDEVWLRELTFQRSAQATAEQPQARQAGYFLVLPKDGGKPQTTDETGWLAQQRLDIKGQAVTHAALARFIQSLSRERGIRDVRLVNTAPSQVASRPVVDFTMAALIEPAVGKRE